MIQQGRPEREILRKIVTRWGVDRTEAQEALRYEMRRRTAKLRRILREEGLIKKSASGKVRVKRKRLDFGYGLEIDPNGGYEVYVDGKYIGDVWKGMDKKWHSSLYGAGYGYRFRSRKDAVADLVEGGYKSTSKSRGQRSPLFE
jgi:hypothetical protein